MKFPDVTNLGTVDIEAVGRFTIWMIREGDGDERYLLTELLHANGVACETHGSKRVGSMPGALNPHSVHADRLIAAGVRLSGDDEGQVSLRTRLARTEAIVGRAARMGGCSQMHHEFIQREAAEYAALGAAQEKGEAGCPVCGSADKHWVIGHESIPDHRWPL